MAETIQTTGGVLHPNDIEFINNCICDVLGGKSMNLFS